MNTEFRHCETCLVCFKWFVHTKIFSWLWRKSIAFLQWKKKKKKTLSDKETLMRYGQAQVFLESYAKFDSLHSLLLSWLHNCITDSSSKDNFRTSYSTKFRSIDFTGSTEQQWWNSGLRLIDYYNDCWRFVTTDRYIYAFQMLFTPRSILMKFDKNSQVRKSSKGGVLSWR